MPEPVQRPVPHDVLLREVQEFSARWDASDRQARCERARRSFLERFPRERLSRLKIEEFAGGIPGTLCDLLVCSHPAGAECEHEDTGVFHDGSPIYAAGVYRGTEAGTYRTMRQQSPESLFEDLRAGLIQVLDHVERREWQEADTVPHVDTLCQLRVRAAYMFFPSTVVPTDRVSTIARFLDLSGLATHEDRAFAARRANNWLVFRWGQRLLERARALPTFDRWPTLKAVDLALDLCDKHLLQLPPRSLGAWAIRVEPDAWSAWQAGGYAALPWPEFGPLAHEQDYETFHGAFVRRFRESEFGGRWASAKAAAAAAWAFRQYPVGEPLVAFVRQRQRSQIVGVGLVEGESHHVAGSPAAHRLRVRWQPLPPAKPAYCHALRDGDFVPVRPDTLAKLRVPLGEEEPSEPTPDDDAAAAIATGGSAAEEPAPDHDEVAATPGGSTTCPPEEEQRSASTNADTVQSDALRLLLGEELFDLLQRRLREPASTAAAGPVDVELLADVGRLRNRLEPKLRRLIRHQLRAHRGAGPQWIQPVLEVLPRERRDQYAGVAADEILRSRLFLSDLINVIHVHWGKYFVVLESGPPRDRLTREQVKVLLDHVNTHRADAHAGALSPAQAASLRIAVEAVEAAIERHLGHEPS